MKKQVKKQVTLALALTLAISPNMQAQSYVKETVAAVATAAGVAALGFLGWQAMLYSQHQADKDSINAVVTIDPEKELNDITALFEQANITKQSVGQVLAHYCATHNISATDLCSKLTNYAKKADVALAKLTTNYTLWQKNNYALAPAAASALNNQQIQEKIQTLHRMCAEIAHEKEYAHLYCAFHSISNNNYFKYQQQFYLVHAVNEMTHDIEKLNKLIHKLDTCVPHDNEQHIRFTNLKNNLISKINDLSFLHQRTLNSREYLEQKSAQFIFEQQQKMVQLEQERIAIEKLKAEKELQEAQLKLTAQNHEWERLHNTIYNLNNANKRLTEEKETYIEKLNQKHESLNALRLELDTLKRQCAGLEQLKTKLLNDLNNALDNNSALTAHYQKIEQELSRLKQKIADLQRKINNPPFNPNSPEMVGWLKQGIVELLA